MTDLPYLPTSDVTPQPRPQTAANADLPLQPLPHRVGYVSRFKDGLRFDEDVYNGADQHEIAGQKIYQPVFTAEQMRAYALAERLAERQRIIAMIRQHSKDTYGVLLNEHEEVAGWLEELTLTERHHLLRVK